jgi:predicted ATPase
MLTCLKIAGFKSHLDSTLQLADLTVLIGANASGKSNALEALELLVWCASGRRLGELSYAMSAKSVRLRGTVADFAPQSGTQTNIHLTATFQEPTQGAWGKELCTLTLRLQLGYGPAGLRVVDETLEAPHAPGSKPLYGVWEAARPGGTEMQVWYNNFARGGQKPRLPAIDQQPVFTQLTTPTRLLSKKQKLSARLIPAACRHVQESLRRIVMLDPVPSRMRGYAFPHETEIQSDGRNLSAVLHGVVKDGRGDQLLTFIRDLPEQDIVAVDFATAPRGEIMVKLRESFGGAQRYVEAVQLSDGTLRVLAIAGALLSVPAGTLVVIEELDNGVHPSRASALLRRIEDTARQRRLRVLITTHNPALMDALSDAAMDNVVVCYRDPTQGHSRLVRLQDLDRYPALVASGSLGQLVTKATLERYLPGLAAQLPDAGDWLSSLLGEE